MSRDPQMLMSIQIALVGIVTVAGFFYIWRALSRIEAKIEALSCRMVDNVCLLNSPAPQKIAPELVSRPVPDDENEDDEEDDFSIMKACFGDIPIESLMDEGASTLMIFNTAQQDQEESEKAVVLEEIPEKAPKPADEASSVAETDSNEFSRSKLKKMPVDSLRELCSSRGLPTDGVKATLVDRILASMPTA